MPKATNISALEAEGLDCLPDNTVLISVNEEHGDLWRLKVKKDDGKVLIVRFSDVTKDEDYKGNTFGTIKDHDALKILDFINRHLGKDFLINCAAGVSRSSAIALYLHLFHGYELKDRFWLLSSPNKYVLGQLIVSKHCKKFQDVN